MYKFGIVSFLFEISVNCLSMSCPVDSVCGFHWSHLFLICSSSAGAESEYLISGVDSAVREMKLGAVVGHMVHDGVYCAEIVLELAGCTISIDM